MDMMPTIIIMRRMCDRLGCVFIARGIRVSLSVTVMSFYVSVNSVSG